jgi:hypothetical protein
MRYIDGDDTPAMAGPEDLADVHEGVDGNLYEWVEGLSAWGEPVGFWQGLAEVPVDTRMSGLGALYQASDGNLYQMGGLEADKDDEEDDDGKEGTMGPKLGPGKPGEIRVGPQGRKYRWVLGLGPGGMRSGFWRRLHPRAAAAVRGAAPPPRARGAAPGRRPGVGAPPPPAPVRKKRKPFLKKLLPFAKFATSFIPGVGPAVRAGLTVADKLLTKKPGVAGDDNLGALYMASDGSLYQVHGIDEDELRGLYDGDRIEGFAADDDLRGFAADDQLVGVDEYGNACGCGPAHVHGVGRDEALDGYVHDVPPPGLQAYVRERPAQTRMFDPNRALPENWKPLW